MNDSLRIAFLGTPAFALPTLTTLLDEGRDVRLVLTQPDRPAGRGRPLQPSPVRRLAEDRGLTVLTPASLDDPAVRTALTEADVAVVVAYGRLIPASLLRTPRHGFLNLHPSLLPRYRGASPIQSAVLHGDRETGVTLMVLDAGLDSGPIVAQTRVPIRHGETSGELSDRLARVGARLLRNSLDPYCSGTLVPTPQEDRAATETRLLTRADGEIDWTEDARAIERRIRAYHPWPGTWTNWRGARVKILRGRATDGHGRPGRIFETAPLRVGCGSGLLVVNELQFAGGRPIRGDDALRGHPIGGGSFSKAESPDGSSTPSARPSAPSASPRTRGTSRA